VDKLVQVVAARVEAMMGVSAPIAERVAAKYKSKKKVKTQDGDDMTVYEYSDRQIANRNKKKAERIEKLRKSIGKLRTTIKKDMKSSDPETSMTALVVALIDETFERVGNEESAKDGHFGVTGWKKKHVSFGDGGATIKYVGKSGVKHEKKVTDPGIKAALRNAYEACDKDNDSLFSGDWGSVNASKVNEYLGTFDVTAKDLRGFHANRVMKENLKAIRAKGKDLPEDKKDREKLLKKEFLKALDETAEAVGHEASTLRSQYLVPSLEDDYMKDGSVKEKHSAAERVASRYCGWF
jgi:DNA topoisomerase-1